MLCTQLRPFDGALTCWEVCMGVQSRLPLSTSFLYFSKLLRSWMLAVNCSWSHSRALVTSSSSHFCSRVRHHIVAAHFDD